MAPATSYRASAIFEWRRLPGVISVGLLALSSMMACTRTRAVESTSAPSVPGAADSGAPLVAPASTPPTTPGESNVNDAGGGRAVVSEGGATVAAWSPPPSSNVDGPHEDLSLDAGRPVYYAMPRGVARPLRLVGHLHGMCGPPPYACGKWIGAGTDVGVMICPTGNARCGDSPVGPASWEAPTWMELVAIMDRDLETAAAKVEAKFPGTIQKEGAILTAYSRGAYAAPVIARRHPNRWRYLVLIEANVSLSVESLQASGVRAVALVAGEYGNEISGMQKTQLDLEQAGFPAKLFVMRRTSHPYSDDMEYVMHDALSFVLAHEDASDSAAR